MKYPVIPYTMSQSIETEIQKKIDDISKHSKTTNKIGDYD